MRLLMVLAILTVTLSGCVDDADTDDVVAPVEKVELTGRVLTPNLNPIEDAVVTVSNPSHMDSLAVATDRIQLTATTDATGNFSLLSYPGVHSITINATGYHSYDDSVVVPTDNLTFQLSPASVVIPYHESFPFDGSIQCAAEYLIMSPSCDTVLTAGDNDYTVFESQAEFDVVTPQGWQSIILDVSFNGDEYPGIAGLRSSVYADDEDPEVLDYQRIHQDWSPGPFSLRIDAGADYGDVIPAPDSDGADRIQFRFFPHGYGDDTICVPEEAPELDPRLAPGVCFLGAGFATDLTFTATATIFVHEPAPPGWTSFATA